MNIPLCKTKNISLCKKLARLKALPVYSKCQGPAEAESSPRKAKKIKKHPKCHQITNNYCSRHVNQITDAFNIQIYNHIFVPCHYNKD